MTRRLNGESYDLVDESITVAGMHFDLLHPKSADDLIDEVEFERDERIPYWAEVWTSSVVLAQWLAECLARQDHRAGAVISRTRLLELGCGIGLVSLLAVRLGYDVLATDYYAEALEFVQLNARRNNQTPPNTRLMDWRELPNDLGTFDVIVAADVLYERAYPAQIAAAIAGLLAPGGVGLVADPGRAGGGRFVEECPGHGLAVRALERVNLARHSMRSAIDLYEVRRSGGRL